MNVIEEVEAIVVRESTITAEEPLQWRIWSALSRLDDMDARELQTLRWFEYDINVCSRESAEEEAAILAWLRPLEIVAAPEVAAVIPFANDDCVLTRRYWACPGERLLPAHETRGPFHAAARMRFRKDMEKLVEHGKVHPYARGLSHVLVSQGAGTLVLNRWNMVRTGTPREQKDLLESIDLQLATRT
jgi:hypothetical protein